MNTPQSTLQAQRIEANRRAAVALMERDRAIAIDLAMHQFKQSNGYDRRADAQALTLQIERATQTGVVL